MKNYFSPFNTIKSVIKKNNEHINTNASALSMLYFGFCNHLFSYMDAYQVLFEASNYYVCKTLDRALLDLYIKARALLMADNPEEVANKILDGKKIKKADLSRIYGKIEGNVTDTDLCHQLDEIDDNYSINQPIDPKYNHRIGILESRYREDCKYIHPDIPCVWSYTTDKQNNYRAIIENDAYSFVGLAQQILTLLSRIATILIQQQNRA